MRTIDGFVARLPKVELHVHLVGSASVRTVLELARRHPNTPSDSSVPRTEEGLREFYVFRDFPHFAAVYRAVSELITEPEDIASLARGVASDMAAQNVRYAEIQVTPWYFTHRSGMPRAAVTEALDLAAREARETHGIRIAWIFDFPGHLADESALSTLEHAVSAPPTGLVGFGIGGIEQRRVVHTDVIRDAFRGAVTSGLHSIPHAGEMTGPETVWEAIKQLHAERIGHGINSLSDPALVGYLRERQLPVDVSPTSNVCTGQVATLRQHPLPRMLSEGLFVTLNSDDPPMFGTSLTNEYLVAASVLGLSRSALANLASNAVRASFLAEDAKKPLLAEIAELAACVT
jgi:aminodeoxyfutalosine deaminase